MKAKKNRLKTYLKIWNHFNNEKDSEKQEQVWKFKKYKAFYDHIKAHFEKEHPDWKVKCKICGKSIDGIFPDCAEQKKTV